MGRGGIAESVPSITDQRVEVNVLNSLPVGVVLPVHATAAGGGSHVDPVGRSIAGSPEALALDKGLGQIDPMTVLELPICGEHPKRSA